MSQSGEPKSCVQLMYVRGIPFPRIRWFNKEIIEEALDFKPRDTDIIINTYPKCGTNWIKYIVHCILTKGDKPLPSSDELLYDAVPCLVLSGVKTLDLLPDPRPMKYHLPYDLIPKNSHTKYIYMFRNPKDVVTSGYHFTLQLQGDNMTFDQYFEAFMQGLVYNGEYFDHVLSWYEHRSDPNVLFLAYEQLKADTLGEMKKIANFLADTYAEYMEDKELAHRILKMTSFDEMKKLSKEAPTETDKLEPLEKPHDVPGTRYTVKYLKFFRKGIVGDWKNHFSPDQNRRMDERIKEKFGGTEIMGMFNAVKDWL